MKKFKSFTAIVIAAIFSTMFIACGSDNGDEPTPTPKKVTYTYQSALTNDFLEFFDVTITKTVGTQSEAIQLTKDYTLGVRGFDGITQYPGKSTPTVSIKVEKGTKVSITATAKLKANWQEIMNGKEQINLHYACMFEQPSGISGSMSEASGIVITPKFYEKWDAERFNTYGTLIAENISMEANEE